MPFCTDQTLSHSLVHIYLANISVYCSRHRKLWGLGPQTNKNIFPRPSHLHILSISKTHHAWISCFYFSTQFKFNRKMLLFCFVLCGFFLLCLFFETGSPPHYSPGQLEFTILFFCLSLPSARIESRSL